MIRSLDTDKIMTSKIVADRLGVSRELIKNWHRRQEDFPKPLTEQDGQEFIWYLPDIEKWMEKTKRSSSKKKKNQYA